MVDQAVAAYREAARLSKAGEGVAPLEQLTRPEWEALCDGCGRCCLHKIEDADTGAIEDTNVACKLLDCATAQCTDYRNRKAFVPDCLRLTLAIVEDVPWLPQSCAYRVRADTIRAIGRVGTQRLIKFLPQLLRDESKFVRIATAKAVLQLQTAK